MYSPHPTAMKRRSIADKRCRNCGDKFTPKRPHQVYCDEGCGTEYRNEKRAKRVREALARLEDRQLEEAGHGA